MPLERRYFDSCIFVYIITGNPHFEPQCSAAVYAAEQGQFTLATSMLTLIEVIKDQSGPHTPSPEIQQKIADFFEHDYVLMVQATRSIMVRARELCWKYGSINLRGNDAVHLASAIYTGCTTLYTFDGTLLKTSEPGILVEKPNVQAQTPLPGVS